MMPGSAPNWLVFMRFLITSALAAAALSFLASGGFAADLWYEDNNLGTAGAMQSDFAEKFRNPQTFDEATRHIDVYMVRAIHLDKMDDAFLSNLLLPYLEQNAIELAIDSGGGTFTQAKGRKRVVDRDIALLQRLKDLGVPVSYVSMQSALSKPLRNNPGKIDYTMDRRIEDVVKFATAAREIYPETAIGIIDALLSHGADYRGPYGALKEALAEAGIPLAYVHLDISFDAPRTGRHGTTWQAIRELESFVESELGAEFGIFTKSRRAGQRSNEAHHHRVIDVLECYAGATGTPAHYILSSNFPHPDRAIPEDGPDYPAMRTVLEFGDLLDTGGVTFRQNDPEWAQLCEAR
jgi:hypothetical protein